VSLSSVSNTGGTIVATVLRGAPPRCQVEWSGGDALVYIGTWAYKGAEPPDDVLNFLDWAEGKLWDIWRSQNP
jgi:hypothetical protein